jgi:hypothetical protein
LHSDVLGGIHHTSANVVSATSDNAARATSREYEKLKVLEMMEAFDLIDNHVREVPESMKAAVHAYSKMTSEQRKHCGEIHELGCVAHSINLTIDDSFKHSEKTTLEANMVRDIASRVIARFLWSILIRKKVNRVGRIIPKGYYLGTSKAKCGFKANTDTGLHKMISIEDLQKGWQRSANGAIDIVAFIRSVSKAFASSGDDYEYYLNEFKEINKFTSDEGGGSLFHIPAQKGSRQSYNLEIATAIVENSSKYVKYLEHVRADSDPNKLIYNVITGLKNRYVQAALRARSLVNVTFLAPLTFFTRSSFVKRTQVFEIMQVAEQFIEDLEDLGKIGDSYPPPLEGLANLILEKFPEFAGAYASWLERKKEMLESAYEKAIHPEFWALVGAHVADGSKFMLATHQRNLDKNCTDIAELKEAPVTSDKVESGFGVLDVHSGNLTCSMQNTIGVAHASLLKLFTPLGEKLQNAQRIAQSKFKESEISNFDEEVHNQMDRWNLTSWWEVPREKRWEILKWCQQHRKVIDYFKNNCKPLK